MLNKRKAAIRYPTYVVGTRAAKRAVRRKAHSMLSTARGRSRPTRRRTIPVVGGAAAAIAGATVIAVRRHHGALGES